MNDGTIQPPTGRKFLSQFLETFAECLPQTPERQAEARKNWTAFVTGKQGEKEGYWEPVETCVLPRMARELGLKYQHEYLRLDLVFFPPGDPWGNFVFVEHELEIEGFAKDDGEVEKLMNVLAPLKVGITYDWKGNPESGSRLEEKIRQLFGTRHPLIREAKDTEYLFLLGIMSHHKTLAWKYLLFKSLGRSDVKHFEDTGKEFQIESQVLSTVPT